MELTEKDGHERLYEELDSQNFLHDLEINSLNKIDVKPEIIQKRIQILTNLQFFLTNLLNDYKVGGKSIRETQKLALISFYSWFKKALLNDSMLGHIILPMGSGKTNLAIMLSEIIGGKTLYLTYTQALGDQTIAAFKEQQQNKHPAFKKRSGKCYGGKKQTDADFIVANYASTHLWNNKIDWSKINLIIVDEADVNSLSDKRAEFIKQKAATLGIPVVGLSATEEQASGRSINSVFEDPIMQMRIPVSLLFINELGLVPDLQFTDLYLDLEFNISRRKAIKRDLQDEEIQNLFKDSEWNKMIINHYQENHSKKKGLIIFRNNLLVQDFIEQAEKMGIKAAAFTGEQTPSELDKLKSDFANGQIDLLVGSKLIGRGLDIPEVDVVYNSLVTYSPQLFWQADGRGFRLDPANKDKQVQIYAVLPRSLKEKNTNFEIPRQERPLCHGAFFDIGYYDEEKPVNDFSDNEDRNFSVPFDYKKVGKDIKSIEEVKNIIKKYYEVLHPKQSRLQLINILIENIETLSVRTLKKILRTKRFKLEKIVSHLYFNNEPLGTCFKTDPDLLLSKKEENKLIHEYLLGKDSPNKTLKNKSNNALNRLIKLYLPSIRTLAKKLSNDQLTSDELTNLGLQFLINKVLKDYSPANKKGILSYIIISLFYYFSRVSKIEEQVIYIPINIESDIASMHNFLDEKEKYGTNADEEDVAKAFKKPVKYIKKLKEVDSLRIEPLDPNSIDLSQEPEQMNNLYKEGFHTQIRKVLATLTPREEKILRLRFGIGENDEHTLQQIADDFDLTRNGIHAIVKKALKTLRHPSRAKRLTNYFEDLDNGEIYYNEKIELIKSKYFSSEDVKLDSIRFLRGDSNSEIYLKFAEEIEFLENPDLTSITIAVVNGNDLIKGSSPQISEEKRLIILEEEYLNKKDELAQMVYALAFFQSKENQSLFIDFWGNIHEQNYIYRSKTEVNISHIYARKKQLEFLKTKGYSNEQIVKEILCNEDSRNHAYYISYLESLDKEIEEKKSDSVKPTKKTTLQSSNSSQQKTKTNIRPVLVAQKIIDETKKYFTF